MKIKKGDTVRVLAGKDKGKEGDVVSSSREANKVIVDGVNTRQEAPDAASCQRAGGIIDKDMPMRRHRTSRSSARRRQADRIGYQIHDDGTKVRVCTPTGAEI